MKHEQLISLESDAQIDPELLISFGEWLKERGVETFLIDRRSFALHEAQKLLRDEGASSLLSQVELREDVLPIVAADERPLLAKLIGTQLLKLQPQDHLVIIDRFLFHAKNNVDELADLFQTIVSPITNQIIKLTFITNGKGNDELYRRIHNELTNINEHLVVAHHCTDEFHDRFWIVDKARGIFVGTSLNGIGVRYALTDYMREADVKAIVQRLIGSGLL